MNGYKNPIDTNLVSGFKLQTAIQTKSGTFIIDEGTATVKVSDFATLQQGRLSVREPTVAEAGTVQHLDTMLLEFFLPVPLNKGCMVTVTLPKQYSISTIQSIYTMQAFGAYKERSLKLGTLTTNKNNNSFTMRACDDYVENSTAAQVEITALKQFNYEAPTDSVLIQIQTAPDLGNNSVQYKVAKADSGITFTPQRGKMQLQAVAADPVVQMPTTVSFTFKPQHTVYISDDPQMQLEFPPDVQISSV